ncbi:hypothetical protein KIW84_070561 [Lathyrus oleraceus]|uniref:CCHC-type domain-containing protein n=1 Tax=Pisum sativum TaxID=3888 RepID=A0A9D4VIB7_PEA|nr:hypothetical protein KIW84_070561 [Pisum sativum]
MGHRLSHLMVSELVDSARTEVMVQNARNARCGRSAGRGASRGVGRNVSGEATPEGIANIPMGREDHSQTGTDSQADTRGVRELTAVVAHLNKDCPNRNIRAYFRCGQKGRFLKDCPQGQNQPISQKRVLINNNNVGRARNGGPNVGQRPQNQNKPTTGRVFTVRGAEISRN